ncbi:MAG: glycosyltransferase family 1 protein, partial [Alphaproteobacteria bacterium]|nr:glycosyltransferase family 1 protein [Alphaproteobacteria bacterium]
PPAFFARLAAFGGPKLLFIQDEYRWVDRTAEAIRDLGISVVFTLLDPGIVRRVYRHPWLDGVRFEHTLAGFVPPGLVGRSVPDFAARPIDVSYRARRLPAWLGAFGQEKWRIGERFARDALAHGLRCDISSAEGDRLYGEKWLSLLARSKAVLGTESGASFIDFTGEVAEAADRYAAANPGAGFEEIAARFLEGRDGDIVIKVISPRCFEAAALRTLMILYPGNYSGVLEAGRHYVQLRHDHANMAEVVALLRDRDRAQKIIDQAYREVACAEQWQSAALTRHFDAVLDGLPALSDWPSRAPLGDQAVKALRRENRRLLRRHLLLRRAAAWAGRCFAAYVALCETRLPGAVGRPAAALSQRAVARLRPWLRRRIFGQ